MNDDELKQLWQGQPLRNPNISPAQLIAAMQNKTSQLRRTLDARDLRELCACAVVILIFGFFYFTVYRTPMSRLGDLIVIGGAIFIACKIVLTRKATPLAPVDATVADSLRAELDSVRAQSRLLGSVLWWYILPLTVGELIATWGLPISLAATVPVSLIIIAINAFVYWLNRWARAKEFVPLEEQLQSLLRSVETGAPMDQTHAANLRPIVLSMEAAQHVKPLEFDVAFWQMAIFGLPGIVGIWFFMMLSQPVGNETWLFGEPAAEKITQVIPADPTNRYGIAARKVVDLVNAGDYAAVQKLFNPAMREFLPPKKASEFFTQLTERFGKFEQVEGPTASSGGWTVFRLESQHGPLTLLVALDANDKISGLYFKPESKRFGNIDSFARRLFTWQRLRWLPAFFLGGLLYSWLMQKLVKRAVGISALGIHLNKGQSLTLWDEIKEVRPFKFLHIQNLWLIKESGEMTIMHWTPLARHADVKAAVECYAPPNHPIRQHLSLLKRI